MVFKKKDSLQVRRFKKIAEAMAVWVGIILFWRGIWVVADVWLYPEDLLISGIISLFAGVLILLLTRNFVKQFLGEMQEDELRAEKTMFESFFKW